MRGLAITLLALGAAWLLAGCGEDKRGATVHLQGHEVTIKADQYYFDPEEIYAKRGELDVTFENVGNLIHNLVFEQDGKRVAKSASLEGGETERQKIRFAPGEYRLLCTVGDHEELGMRGKLIIE